jgi:hypothetical protein
MSVGMLGFVRLQVMPIDPVNVPEFGSVMKEDEFRGLLAMSSYHHVKDGTPYPAVLLQHGVNDARVNVGQSNKMAARLIAATTSCKPIPLDLEYEAGHGQGGTKEQRQRQITITTPSCCNRRGTRNSGQPSRRAAEPFHPVFGRTSVKRPIKNPESRPSRPAAPGPLAATP